MRLPLVIFGAVVLAAASDLAAQGPTASSRRSAAGIRGIVYDSLLAGAPLVGAEVFLEGTSGGARSDEKGNYAITGLPAGRYVVGFSHPTLDALGITLPLRNVEVTAGTVVTLPLTTPSLNTLYPRLCNAFLPAKTGILIGRLTDADTDRPVTDGEVVAEWSAIVLDRNSSPRSTNQTARAVTDADGRFLLCGVPVDVPVGVRGGKDARFGPIAQVDLDNRGLKLRNITVSLGDLASVPRPEPLTPGAAVPIVSVGKGTASLSGTIVDGDGAPIVGAEVRVIGADTPPARTQDNGGYSMGGLPSGTATVEVRALGFGPYRTLAELRRGRNTTLDATILKEAVQLAPLSVTGGETLFDRSGFEQRRKNGLGHFLTDEDIRARNAIRLEDAFRGVPGVQLIPVGLGGFAVVFPRAGGQAGVFAGRECYPSYFVDGSLYAGLDPQVSGGLPIPPGDVRGIEIYNSLSSAPPQYQRLDSGCGVILIWTKRGAPTKTFER